MIFNYITSAVATKVSTAPVLLKSILVEPHDGKQGSVTLYDGTSVSDPKILVFKTPTGVTKEWDFGEGLKTERGLYLGAFSDADGCLLQFTTDVNK